MIHGKISGHSLCQQRVHMAKILCLFINFRKVALDPQHRSSCHSCIGCNLKKLFAAHSFQYHLRLPGTAPVRIYNGVCKHLPVLSQSRKSRTQAGYTDSGHLGHVYVFPFLEQPDTL